MGVVWCGVLSYCLLAVWNGLGRNTGNCCWLACMCTYLFDAVPNVKPLGKSILRQVSVMLYVAEKHATGNSPSGQWFVLCCRSAGYPQAGSTSCGCARAMRVGGAHGPSPWPSPRSQTCQVCPSLQEDRLCLCPWKAC
jgi:hypothetical protein